MGKPFQTYLDAAKIYTCNCCHAHLAKIDDIKSKSFHGRSGKAYLFSHVENYELGEKEQRPLLTGVHLVADVACAICRTVIGWKYLIAYEEDQKYKEGMFIVERAMVTAERPPAVKEFSGPVTKSTTPRSPPVAVC